MYRFSISRKLIVNTKNFLDIKKYSFIDSLVFRKGTFYGWGRKKSGIKAVELAKKNATSFVLLEDGFIRSIGLGVDQSPSFSIVEDDVGIYYDAMTPSKLEQILDNYDFDADLDLMKNARRAIELIKKYHISKYNNTPIGVPTIFHNDGLDRFQRVLIIAQTTGDASLKYGMVDNYTTNDMINVALEENPGKKVYLKIHPDVLSGKKGSDIELDTLDNRLHIIMENTNPVTLLKNVGKVYTKTSQMGFEALLVGCECVCFGMPFYSGWGLTDDRFKSDRRKRNLRVEEVFAAAYLLYTRYCNPYRDRASDIFDAIEEIVRQREKLVVEQKYDVLALGDSHIRVFEHVRYFYPHKNIEIVYVPGGTALGINNLQSVSGAYKKFLDSLEKYDYDRIVITLGEVDTSYTIWAKAEQTSLDVEYYLNKSIDNYKNFLLKLVNYAPVIVLSATLPTQRDNIGCNDNISNIRKTVDIPQYERTELALEFNQRIMAFCEKKDDILYLDLDKVALASKGTAKRWLLNPMKPCDHHYGRWAFSMLVSWKLRNIL